MKIDIGAGFETIIDDEDVRLVIGKAIRLDMLGSIPYARVSIYGEGQKRKKTPPAPFSSFRPANSPCGSC